jgi:CBS domain-containing protein
VPIRTEYTVDYLHQLLVKDASSRTVVSLRADAPLSEVREWLARGADGATHQGFPVLDDREQLVGVVTRRGLTDPSAPAAAPIRSLLDRPPVVIYDDSTLREAADQMVREKVGRLPVVKRDDPRTVVGMITRSDLLGAHAARLASEQRSAPIVEVPRRWWRREPVGR